MELRPQITRVVLENYKSIAFCDVKLGPLSILVGPNASGKSNFLDALRFLSEAMNAPVEKAFQSREGIANVLRRGARDDAHLGFRIEFTTAEGLSGFYSVRFTRGTVTDYIVDTEKYAIGRKGLHSQPTAVHSDRQIESIRLSLPSMTNHVEFNSIWRLLSDCQFYNFDTSVLRKPIPSARERVLRSDGANLATVVDHLSRLRPAVFERIVQYLTVINPALSAIKSIETGGFLALQFREDGDVFYPLQISDGTILSLATLVALFERAGGADKVSLIGLEEPETALHPAAAGVLFDALQEASCSVQVIATTHSADLLDKKEIDTDAILSVQRHEGASQIGHLDATGRQALKEQLHTPGELMRMNYLRPESGQPPDEETIESILFDNLVPA